MSDSSDTESEAESSLLPIVAQVTSLPGESHTELEATSTSEQTLLAIRTLQTLDLVLVEKVRTLTTFQAELLITC